MHTQKKLTFIVYCHYKLRNKQNFLNFSVSLKFWSIVFFLFSLSLSFYSRSPFYICLSSCIYRYGFIFCYEYSNAYIHTFKVKSYIIIRRRGSWLYIFLKNCNPRACAYRTCYKSESNPLRILTSHKMNRKNYYAIMFDASAAYS